MVETRPPSFEPAEFARPWTVGAAITGFLLFAIMVMAILLPVYLAVAPKPQPPETFPEPRLQPSPQADFKAFLNMQQRKLQQSGWIDKSAGIAAIPVEKAMKIIAGRGRSAFDPLPGSAPDQKGATP
ncbi:MAG: hypothetical protein L0I29_10260 [Hyphomicrobiales bacterium]|nr:hypothetical protein [Hyphomicrobiales bacterium]